MTEPAAPPISRLWWAVGPVAVALVVAIVVLLARPVPYLVFTPGSAQSVEPLITLERKGSGPIPHVEKPNDDILFVTVSVIYPSGLLTLVELLNDKAEVAPSAPYLGTQTRDESRTYNQSLMTDSKAKAAKVALERAGYQVKVTQVGAVLIDVDPTFPAAKVLKPGDTVVAADGRPIATAKELVAAIAAHRPGDRLALTVQRLGVEGDLVVRAPLVENKTKPGKAQLGVQAADRPKFDFPITVGIKSGDVGGPSAGLAFTLALLDRLTPGDLTGGTKVAVTGTIELDGSVGPVGGVVQKTEAAISEGAKVFLVPPDEFADATRTAHGRLKVVAVSSLDEALAALQRLGGDPLPASPATGTGG